MLAGLVIFVEGDGDDGVMLKGGDGVLELCRLEAVVGIEDRSTGGGQSIEGDETNLRRGSRRLSAASIAS